MTFRRTQKQSPATVSFRESQHKKIISSTIAPTSPTSMVGSDLYLIISRYLYYKKCSGCSNCHKFALKKAGVVAGACFPTTSRDYLALSGFQRGGGRLINSHIQKIDLKSLV